jgi:outer membrane protein assembly factor BamB
MRVLPESKWARRGAYGALAVVLLAVSGVIVWRVLAPTEVVTQAVTAYPAVDQTTPGPVGALVAAPLIVDGRIRVYADKRQIRSDDQPAYKYEKSPFWSYRRWPEQLVGVVHPQTAAPGVPVIVGAWTDGKLVALDGRSGTVLWRADGETLSDGYDGRRTGSSVVWTPQGLLTGVGNQPVVVTVGDQSVSAYAAVDGSRLWQAETTACTEQAFTAKGALLAPDTCVGPHALIRFDLTTGEQREQPFQKGFNDELTVTPLGCRIGRSECGGVRMLQQPNRTAAWMLSSGDFVGSEALASPTASLAGDIVIDSPLGGTASTHVVIGRNANATTGQSLWTFSRNSPVRLIAATAERVLLLSEDRTLIALDPATGRILSSDSVVLKQDPKDAYAVGSVYTDGPYVAIERLKPKADATGTDDEYYYNARPVLLAVS